MFTGIIEEVGTVKSCVGDRLTVAARLVLEDARPGDSLAVNGACLTVIAVNRPMPGAEGTFTAELMPETRRRTNLGELRPGDRVNLERALKPGSRMGGHFVQGHVDATGHIISLTPEGNAVRVRIAAPPEVMRYVVPQGFIAVDGISLTVAEMGASDFVVSLVPYTRQNVTLAEKHAGQPVNLEVDILAKYVERLLRARPNSGRITEEFLAQHGFK